MTEDIQTPENPAPLTDELGHIAPGLRGLAVSVDTLSADPSNARTHSAHNLNIIRGSLAKFGQVKPVVADQAGVVLAGNGSLQAARALGWRFIAAVRVGFDGATAAAFAIADNRAGETSEWDNDALARLLNSLRADDSIDELVTGFNPDEIAKLIADAMGEGEMPAGANGTEYTEYTEYTEAAADDVERVTCPHCGKEFPK
jgi:hypothetical protein